MFLGVLQPPACLDFSRVFHFLLFFMFILFFVFFITTTSLICQYTVTSTVIIIYSTSNICVLQLFEPPGLKPISVISKADFEEEKEEKRSDHFHLHLTQQ